MADFMKEKLSNRKERTTSSSYPPPPPHSVKKRFLAFLFAAVLFVALAGCSNGYDGCMKGAGAQKPAGSFYTVSYETGNGTGIPWSEEINEPPRRKRANKFADAKWRGIL
jgi:hypothetical protein